MEDIAEMEELRTLGTKRNLAEELYNRIGPFDFEKNETRKMQAKNQKISLNLKEQRSVDEISSGLEEPSE